MKLTRVGVDLAKDVFQLHGVDRAERPVWCKRLKRNRWIEEIEQNVEPGVEIGMEPAEARITGPACCNQKVTECD
jgi:transposase